MLLLSEIVDPMRMTIRKSSKRQRETLPTFFVNWNWCNKEDFFMLLTLKKKANHPPVIYNENRQYACFMNNPL